jgi:predicted GNAT superfamily acetyltransferase
MIRNARPDDFPEILALNAESVHFLSPLDATRLRHLHAQAAYHRVVEREGKIDAFLLAFREGVDYDSLNYRWFAQNFPRFPLHRSDRRRRKRAWTWFRRATVRRHPCVRGSDERRPA